VEQVLRDLPAVGTLVKDRGYRQVWRFEHDGRAYEITLLGLDPAGSLRLAVESEWSEQHVAVNREFLLQALDAGGAGQLVLELDGPIHPLAVRVPGESRFSILMPVRP